MHSKSDKIEIMIYDKADKVTKELFQSVLSKYQLGLEISMKGSDFIFDHININLNHSVSIIDCVNINLNYSVSYIDSHD